MCFLSLEKDFKKYNKRADMLAPPEIKKKERMRFKFVLLFINSLNHATY